MARWNPHTPGKAGTLAQGGTHTQCLHCCSEWRRPDGSPAATLVTARAGGGRQGWGEARVLLLDGAHGLGGPGQLGRGEGRLEGWCVSWDLGPGLDLNPDWLCAC